MEEKEVCLVFKGHETRGKDLLKVLKMLGGYECGYCIYPQYYYYIEPLGSIVGVTDLYSGKNWRVFTLEEFEEQYPFTIGSKVLYCGYNYEVIGMSICDGEVYCRIKDNKQNGVILVKANDLTLKEDVMNTLSTVEIDEDCLELIYDKETHEIITENDRIFLVKKKFIYPETYKECCKILGDLSVQLPSIRTHTSEYDNLFTDFYKLIICRNAYWKLFNDWKPNFNDGTMKFTIECHAGIIIDCGNDMTQNVVLVFPTVEMRNAFYSNFEILIKKCKQFL